MAQTMAYPESFKLPRQLQTAKTTADSCRLARPLQIGPDHCRHVRSCLLSSGKGHGQNRLVHKGSRIQFLVRSWSKYTKKLIDINIGSQEGFFLVFLRCHIVNSLFSRNLYGAFRKISLCCMFNMQD